MVILSDGDDSDATSALVSDFSYPNCQNSLMKNWPKGLTRVCDK